ncbi:MFS family permease [Neorhizobium sp. 2083]|uniref:MFS transporter n=1 Tax=Neorhizobium sp. 2083 TaxID=2817762 RepID=UPI00285683F5|nr:MFS transporter [Neorhizobium sp. 2083]MDR6817895.1 MFS family permease [Neorhizobium sp. 2083]
MNSISDDILPMTPPARGALHRWFVSNGLLSTPQAAAPIVFALVALPLTGDAKSGAAVVMALTLAQVLGAVPVARLGRSYNAVTYLKFLIAIRTLAFAIIAVLAACQAPFVWMIVAGAAAGFVNGAASGYMRALLNYLVEPGRLLKALGITATLNELTFVIAPVAASLLGSVSPPFAIGVITLLGGAPLLLIPRMPHARAPAPAPTEGGLITPSILLWLFCSMAGGAAVGVIEVGAVALALDFGFKPELGIIFTVALCIASVCGGVWVSLRNRLARQGTVIFLLAAATGGAILVSLRHSVELSALGCIVVGLMIAPLGTYYSVVLDGLAPPSKRSEIFALLRTANSVGIIFSSAALTWTSLPSALIAGAALFFIATLATAASVFRSKR